MIIRPNCVLLTHKMREIIHNADSAFPYVALESDLDLYAGNCAPWHWHEYFEFIIIARGEVRVSLESGDILLCEGDGCFFNADVLHRITASDPGRSAVVHAQQIGRELIAGIDRIARRYVIPIENCPALEALVLRADCPEHRPLLCALRQAFQAAGEDDSGHELRICAAMSRAWERLYALAREHLLSAPPAPREKSLRMKAMLSLIHSRYSEQISVKDIASAAGICERECFRSFSDLLAVTPMEYLSRYRITAAMRMLQESSLSIAGIAAACGFNDTGYFGKVFKSSTGLTPSAYRKQHTGGPKDGPESGR